MNEREYLLNVYKEVKKAKTKKTKLSILDKAKTYMGEHKFMYSSLKWAVLQENKVREGKL